MTRAISDVSGNDNREPAVIHARGLLMNEGGRILVVKNGTSWDLPGGTVKGFNEMYRKVEDLFRAQTGIEVAEKSFLSMYPAVEEDEVTVVIHEVGLVDFFPDTAGTGRTAPPQIRFMAISDFILHKNANPAVARALHSWITTMNEFGMLED